MDHFLLKYTKNGKETGEVEDRGLQKCSVSRVGYSATMGFWLAAQTYVVLGDALYDNMCFQGRNR